MKKRAGRKTDKRAQHIIGMPFGIIFSIFLIVIFIIIAFIVVKHFLSIGSCAEVGIFYEDFQKKINEAWVSQSSESEVDIAVASGITAVCFANLSAKITEQENYGIIKNYDVYDANLFLLPPEKACNMPYKKIEHINITKITESKNPYCIDVSKKLKIKKDFYDKLVSIE